MEIPSASPSIPSAVSATRWLDAHAVVDAGAIDSAGSQDRIREARVIGCIGQALWFQGESASGQRVCLRQELTAVELQSRSAAFHPQRDIAQWRAQLAMAVGLVDENPAVIVDATQGKLRVCVQGWWHEYPARAEVEGRALHGYNVPGGNQA